MARFLFVTWDGGGNEPSAIGIAQALRARGHDVVFAGQELAPPVMVAGYETQGERIARHGGARPRADRRRCNGLRRAPA